MEKDLLSIHDIPYDHFWWKKNESEAANFWDKVCRYREQHPDWKEKIWVTPDPNYVKTIARNIQDDIDDIIEERHIKRKRKKSGFDIQKPKSRPVIDITILDEQTPSIKKHKNEKACIQKPKQQQFSSDSFCYLEVVDDSGSIIPDYVLNSEKIFAENQDDTNWNNNWKPPTPIKNKNEIKSTEDYLRPDRKNQRNSSSESEKKKKIICPFK
jgi:hypothetical protein